MAINLKITEILNKYAHNFQGYDICDNSRADNNGGCVKVITLHVHEDQPVMEEKELQKIKTKIALNTPLMFSEIIIQYEDNKKYQRSKEKSTIALEESYACLKEYELAIQHGDKKHAYEMAGRLWVLLKNLKAMI